MLRTARRAELEKEFDLFTTIQELKPRDVGFKPCKPGEQAGEVARPYFDVYIPRETIAYFERGSISPNRLYTERQLVASLREGPSILLIGAPTEAKREPCLSWCGVSTVFTLCAPRKIACRPKKPCNC